MTNPSISEEPIDMMDTLPDSLFFHILTLLPTKSAVVICMLSPRRRRNLCHQLDFLDFTNFDFLYCPRLRNPHFDDETVFHHMGLQLKTLDTRFVDFINGVFSLRTMQCVRKFRISCTYDLDTTFYLYSLESWILAIVGPHLQELQLFLPSATYNVFYLPISVFSCTSLVSLSLFGTIILQKPSSPVHLPLLKTLEVDVFNAQPAESISTILLGCPILESLYLGLHSYFIDVPLIMVPSSVKRYTLVDRTFFDIDDLVIATPSLQYLNITITSSCLQFSVSSLDNVVEAHLDIYSEGGHVSLVFDLLRALRKTKFLDLRCSTIECLLLVPDLDFPEFSYLIHVELVLPNLNFSFVLDILQKCPMLQVITIEKDKKPESSFLERWTPPTTVPNCLVSHLTMIIFRGYQGSPKEVAFTAYILLRGLVLKTLTVHTHFSLSLEEKHWIFEQLSNMPKASNKFQLVFT
ncbi:hypothetical protein TanjilG_00451 [Lupinus angustifolius]|uniref:FBD domain-containing protein n=1 Tax=Lupinus angustifolius TaxID=3871 RepID=A0A1J7FPS7_LUPAN|nr:PREDICTED: F-box/FBD/LRR-repeat protein At4g26340-like [Lupinus angustifolius]OIV89935.1 hypothetical protein TanjilG_00451 [Lupinus angustifolius]